MKRRRSEIFLLFLAVVITFAIVFLIMRGSTNEGEARVSSTDVNQSQTENQMSDPVEIQSEETVNSTQEMPSQSVAQPQVENQPAGQEPVIRPTAASSSDITGATHFVDCAFRTGGNAIIGIPKDIILNGSINLDPGDEIAVFTPGGDVCSGAAVWTGENIALTAWGDDADTDPIEGFQEGDDMRFRIWNQSSGEEKDISAATYLQGNGKYMVDGIYVLQSFNGG